MKVYAGRASDILGSRRATGTSPIDDADPDLMHDDANVVVSINAVNGGGKSLIYIAFEKTDFNDLANVMMKADARAAERAFLLALLAATKSGNN